MEDERLICVDEKDEILGYLRKESLPFIHRVSLVIPRGYQGKFIFSRRAKDKEPFPDTWVCLMGEKCRREEDYLRTALRGMKEEAGVDLNKKDMRYLTKFLYNEDDYQAHFGLFTTSKIFSPSDFRLDKREADFARDFSLEEISKMMKEDPDEFAPTFIRTMEYFRKFFK